MSTSAITAERAAGAERSPAHTPAPPACAVGDRAAAWRAVLAPFWGSRALVWLVGCVSVLALGAVPANDPTRISTSFGRLGNLLAAPAVRWDAVDYLQIVHNGYQGARDTGFYPLYPLVVRATSYLTGSAVLAGVLVSLVAMFVALVVVRRLTELELGSQAAGVAVDLIAFGPMALFLSAVYTESLFLALSAGMFYAARRGRWATAGLLGGLAAATRVTGIALFVPMVLMFFYGPRTDRPAASIRSRWRPRYRFTPAVLWSALIPAGFGAFALYLRLRGFTATSMIQVQQHILVHQLAFPAVTAWEGVRSAWHQIVLEVRGVPPLLYQQQSIFQTVAMCVAVGALVGVLRRLPIAYGAYVVVGLTIALSTPTAGDPLRGLARYASVLFPLVMWGGAKAVERGIVRTVVAGSGVLMVLFTIEFSTWHVVGAPLF